jgi:hypothetical protein
MDDVRALVTQMTLDAEDMLWEELMFKEGDAVRFTVLARSRWASKTAVIKGQRMLQSSSRKRVKVCRFPNLLATAGKDQMLLEAYVRYCGTIMHRPPSSAWVSIYVLTGTLPLLRQREFEEAMQLQNPLYIRLSSHRVNIEYSIKRVRNGRRARGGCH